MNGRGVEVEEVGEEEEAEGGSVPNKEDVDEEKYDEAKTLLLRWSMQFNIRAHPWPSKAFLSLHHSSDGPIVRQCRPWRIPCGYLGPMI